MLNLKKSKYFFVFIIGSMLSLGFTLLPAMINYQNDKLMFTFVVLGMFLWGISSILVYRRILSKSYSWRADIIIGFFIFMSFECVKGCLPRYFNDIYVRKAYNSQNIYNRLIFVYSWHDLLVPLVTVWVIYKLQSTKIFQIKDSCSEN